MTEAFPSEYFCELFEVVRVLDFLSPRVALRQRPAEMIETERGLAIARAVLAVSSLVALHLYPTETFPAQDLVFGLILLYAAHAMALLVLLLSWNEVPRRFSWTVQTADI